MNTVINKVDYGPLAQLIRKWVENKGLDTAPDANAKPDETAFSDEIFLLLLALPKMWKNRTLCLLNTIM